MGKLERAGLAVGILVSLGGLWDAYVTRKRNREVLAKDDEIRALKVKLAKFEVKEKP